MNSGEGQGDPRERGLARIGDVTAKPSGTEFFFEIEERFVAVDFIEVLESSSVMRSNSLFDEV